MAQIEGSAVPKGVGYIAISQHCGKEITEKFSKYKEARMKCLDRRFVPSDFLKLSLISGIQVRNSVLTEYTRHQSH